MKPTIIKGYKVLTIEANGKFISAVIRDKKLITSYRLNEWTKPSIIGTRLFAFISFDDANRFAEQEYYWDCKRRAIFEAELFNPKTINRICVLDNRMISNPVYLKNLSKIFKDLLAGKQMDMTTDIMFTSYACTKIKLTRRVS